MKDNTNFSCHFNSDTDRYCPIFSIGYILQNLHEQDSKINLIALYHQVKFELKFIFLYDLFLFLYRVVLLKFNRIGNVILILPKKKKNAFLLSSLIYYKVEAMNYLQASTIGETNTKVFCHILYSICFSIDLLINIISMEDSIEH